jgi:hypothetical protein
MKEPYSYARCNFTRTGHPDIRFDIIVKTQTAKLDALRLDPNNAGLSDGQLWGGFVGHVVTLLYPAPGASFSIGCIPYPEGHIPTEIEGRAPSGTVNDLTFWAV